VETGRTAKSPEAVTDWVFAVVAAERRFVRVKVTGAVVLWMGTEPKLGFVGVN
jgi:hypothetical protein